MKWVQTKDMLDYDGVKNKSEREKLFKEYEKEEDLQKDLADNKKFEKWITFPDDVPGSSTFELDRKAQRKYEIICGGFLYYHDVEFKKYPKGEGYAYPDPPQSGIAANWKTYPNTTFEHYIYFEWFPKNGKENKKNRVIIHINPTPAEFNPKPPPPPPPPPPESS